MQSLGTDELKEALLTDQDNTQATAKLAALESLAGGPAPVTVDPSVSAFDANKVSVVGANLNNKQFGKRIRSRWFWTNRPRAM